MVKVHILGSAAALPLVDRASAGLAVQIDGRVYLFDAGPGVATRLLDSAIRWFYDPQSSDGTGCDAQVINPYDLRAVFISHGHIDHIGDVPQLVSALRLLAKRDPAFRFGTENRLPLYLPPEMDEPLRRWLRATGIVQKLRFELDIRALAEGSCFECQNVRVEAVRSAHCAPNDHGMPSNAFSFRIWAGGKRIVYTGDVNLTNAEALIDGGADLLVTECAHVPWDGLVRLVREKARGRVLFTHLSPEICVKDRQAAALLRDQTGGLAELAADGQIIEL